MSANPSASDSVLVGVGIDVADVQRFERLLARGGTRLWQRWFTAAESRQCAESSHPVQVTAMRFAVKEATLKSIGASFEGPVRWQDIEVLHDGHGLRVRTYGEVADQAHAAVINRFRATTGQTSRHSLAIVLAERQVRRGSMTQPIQGDECEASTERPGLEGDRR